MLFWLQKMYAFEHHGMDFYRLGGAILANFRDGFGAQGASTLTQQVVKTHFTKREEIKA